VSSGDPSSSSPQISNVVSVIACNEQGKPVLVIEKDPATGKELTVVKNFDGTHRAFGDETVNSLVSNTEDVMTSWLQSLNAMEIKGVLNVVNKHIAEGSRLYHATKQAVEQMTRAASYSYFGLPEDTAEKDLDNAYRQLAKKMHPDKNGGTEDATVKFQHMKDCYEALKRERASPQGGDKENRENREEDSNADSPPDVESQSKSEQKQSGTPKPAGKKHFAELLVENNKSMLDEAALEMLQTLKSINSNMAILQAQQEKLASQK
jgi:hypothetical protein